MEEDKGHQRLVTDIKILQEKAENFAFHDFKNEEYATPKMALIGILNRIISRAKEGEYDN